MQHKSYDANIFYSLFLKQCPRHDCQNNIRFYWDRLNPNNFSLDIPGHTMTCLVMSKIYQGLQWYALCCQTNSFNSKHSNQFKLILIAIQQWIFYHIVIYLCIVYLLCEASLRVTIIVTGPVLMFLNMDIASLWDIPCTDIPLTDNISSPENKTEFYRVRFLEFVFCRTLKYYVSVRIGLRILLCYKITFPYIFG